MFDFFKIGRSKPRRTDHAADDTRLSQPANSAPQSTQQHTATHRELIRVVLRDTLRMNGIPTDWITCEILKMSRSADNNGLLIQLVIQQWHEDLLRYAPALQQQLLLGLARFDPASDHSKHIVNWKFSPNCACPCATLPAPEFWSTSLATNAKPAVAPPPSGHDPENSGFSPTIPRELR